MNPKLKPTFAVTRKVAVMAAENIDWDKISEHGWPLCFHVMENGKFCGESEMWFGHDVINPHHEFVSLADLVRGIV